MEKLPAFDIYLVGMVQEKFNYLQIYIIWPERYVMTETDILVYDNAENTKTLRILIMESSCNSV